MSSTLQVFCDSTETHLHRGITVIGGPTRKRKRHLRHSAITGEAIYQEDHDARVALYAFRAEQGYDIFLGPLELPPKPLLPHKKADFVGTVRGSYRLIEELPRRVRHLRYFKAVCIHCGQERKADLRLFHNLRCPCQCNKHPLKDYANERFGHFTVIKEAPRDKNGRRCVVARCDCGEIRIKSVKWLKSTSNCGCVNAKRMSSYSKTHGLSREKKKNGKPTPEFHIWMNIRHGPKRHKRLKHARGTKVYEGWANSFPQFLNDVGPRPAPDMGLYRLDASMDWEPGNVAWMKKADAKNSKTKLVEIDGIAKSQNMWCKHFGLPPATVIQGSQRYGMDFKTALLYYVEKAQQCRNTK